MGGVDGGVCDGEVGGAVGGEAEEESEDDAENQERQKNGDEEIAAGGLSEFEFRHRQEDSKARAVSGR